MYNTSTQYPERAPARDLDLKIPNFKFCSVTLKFEFVPTTVVLAAQIWFPQLLACCRGKDLLAIDSTLGLLK
jgi:hypothetical protein